MNLDAFSTIALTLHCISGRAQAALLAEGASMPLSAVHLDDPLSSSDLNLAFLSISHWHLPLPIYASSSVQLCFGVLHSTAVNGHRICFCFLSDLCLFVISTNQG